MKSTSCSKPPLARDPAVYAIRAGWAVLLWVLLSAPALGLPNDQEQPIMIEADSVEIDEGKNISIYKGSVEVQQGSMRLLADEVTVHHRSDRRPARIVAIGKPARYRQVPEPGKKEVKAKALRMEYDANSEEIALIGKAELLQGKDSFRSDRILYDRKQAVVKAGASAKGRERVRIVINPKKK